MTAPELEAGSADWALRALCPDDSCIGVLDLDGCCNVCGKQGQAAADRGPAERGPAAQAPAENGPAALDDLDERPLAAASATSGEATGEDAAFDDRELCPDDSCIGVLDDSRTCKVCGRKP